MQAPGIVRVKISSEAVGTIALSPVVARDLTVAALTAEIVAVTGKDRARLIEIFRRGTFASGASRFRWQGFDIGDGEAASLLAAFPDPDPSRPFSAPACIRFLLRGPTARIPLERGDAAARRWFRRRSFWDELVALTPPPDYAGYSYKEGADVYRAGLTSSLVGRLVDAARLSPFTALPRQIEAAAIDTIEFYVKR